MLPGLGGEKISFLLLLIWFNGSIRSILVHFLYVHQAAWLWVDSIPQDIFFFVVAGQRSSNRLIFKHSLIFRTVLRLSLVRAAYFRFSREDAAVFLIFGKVFLRLQAHFTLFGGVPHNPTFYLLGFSVVFDKIFLVQSRAHIPHFVTNPHILLFSFGHSLLHQRRDEGVSVVLVAGGIDWGLDIFQFGQEHEVIFGDVLVVLVELMHEGLDLGLLDVTEVINALGIISKVGFLAFVDLG